MTAELALDQLLTVEEYLEAEEAAEVKHEYLGGVLYEMAGGTRGHATISTNVLGVLHRHLRGKPCRPFNSDMKVRIEFPTHTRFYYPDAMVVCERGPFKSVYLNNPTVIVEATSDSTRRTDVQEKREAYLTIPTLRVYLLLEQDTPAAVVWRRVEQSFQRETYRGRDAVIDLPEIGAQLPLAEVYEAEDFPAADPVA